MFHLSFDIQKLSTIVKGNLILQKESEQEVNTILIDSRNLVNPLGCMFVAIKTSKNDGHHYIHELANKGICNFLISSYSDDLPDANYIVVEDSLKAIQQIGAYHRKQFDIPVIGITGSNGKTIIKEWLYQMMSPDKKIVRSPKSYNSQIGVPLSVLQMSENDELAIFEAGISEPEEMDNLTKVIQPQIGIFTNIGQAHSENFINLRQKVNEKLQLFIHADTLIYCRDYGDISERINNLQIFRETNLLTWSQQHKDVDLYVLQVKKAIKRTHISAIYHKEEISIQIPFLDAASIENSIHVWLCMLHLGYTNDIIQKRILSLAPIAMRLELKEGIQQCSVINDSYNSDINSLNIALDFLCQQKQNKKKTIILSDILQSGMNDFELYAEIDKLLVDKGIDQLIGIGPNITREAKMFHIPATFFPSTDDFIHYYPFSNFQKETILLKGARSFAFERILKILEQKTHETVLEVDLSAMVENYNYFRKALPSTTKIMAMVKAYSYGSGSFELANALQYHNVDYLAVAYADEGVELRNGGITLPIMVMNPQAESFDFMIQYNLEPEIFSFRILNQLLRSLDSNLLEDDKKIGIHIKIDSGMHRLGFEFEELKELVKILKNNTTIKVQSVFSHLATSDSENDDAFTHQQIAYYTRCADFLEENLSYSFIKHIANSAAITRFPEAQLDMVRLGIAMYGIASDSAIADKLQNVQTLKTIVSQVKHIKAGESIGYNRSYKAETDMISATVPIGYADGLNRRLSNGIGTMYIHGKPAPIIGMVCMDMCMLDVSKIDDVKAGDEAIVFSSKQHIIDIAEKTQTIVYEVLTGISRRVKRVYFQE